MCGVVWGAISIAEASFEGDCLRFLPR
jgi:hypothetical protein